jgi:hypothetical protein
MIHALYLYKHLNFQSKSKIKHKNTEQAEEGLLLATVEFYNGYLTVCI